MKVKVVLSLELATRERIWWPCNECPLADLNDYLCRSGARILFFHELEGDSS